MKNSSCGGGGTADLHHLTPATMRVKIWRVDEWTLGLC